MTSILFPNTSTGHLLINGVSLHTPAWTMLDLIELWMPPELRGANVIIPAARGRRAYPMRVDETDYLLPMNVSGAVDQMNVPDDDGFMACLSRNLKFLNDFVVGPKDGTTATWAAELSLPTGVILEAEVQVLGIRPSRHVAEWTSCTMTLRIPDGEFT